MIGDVHHLQHSSRAVFVEHRVKYRVIAGNTRAGGRIENSRAATPSRKPSSSQYPASSEATQQQSISQTLDTLQPADRPVSGFVNVLKTRVSSSSSSVQSQSTVNALNFVRSDKGPKLVCYHTNTTTPPQHTQSRISQSSTVVVQRLQSTHQR